MSPMRRADLSPRTLEGAMRRLPRNRSAVRAASRCARARERLVGASARALSCKATGADGGRALLGGPSRADRPPARARAPPAPRHTSRRRTRASGRRRESRPVRPAPRSSDGAAGVSVGARPPARQALAASASPTRPAARWAPRTTPREWRLLARGHGRSAPPRAASEPPSSRAPARRRRHPPVRAWRPPGGNSPIWRARTRATMRLLGVERRLRERGDERAGR